MRLRNKRKLGILVVGVVVIALLGIACYYTVDGEDEPEQVTVAVRGYLSVEQKEALTRQLVAYAPEQSKDLTLFVLEFPASANAEQTSRLLGELISQIQTGSSNLYLVDANVYGMIGNDTLFEDLSVKYPNDPAVTERYRYAIKEKPFANASGLENLPELYFLLRSSQSSIVNRNAQTLDRFQKQSELLDNIAYSTPVRMHALES